MNDKYVVIKRDDWVAVKASLRKAIDDPQTTQVYRDAYLRDLRTIERLEALELDDAEVVRKQDILAGPVLHAYANTAQTFIEGMNALAEFTITDESMGAMTDRLETIADHFHQAAVDADEWPTKKVPD